MYNLVHLRIQGCIFVRQVLSQVFVIRTAQMSVRVLQVNH
jgi:hypothetical protein